MSSETWSRCLSQMGAVEKAILDVIEQQSANLDKAINRFLQDDFVRQFFVRFVLSTSILQCHNSFKDPKHFPSCHPPLPTNLSTAPEIIAAIRELVQLADVGGLYNFPDGTAAPPTAPATSSTPTAASAGTGAAVATPASAGTGSLNGGASNSALNAPAVKEGTPSGPAEDG
ncbi:hypothetical protein HK102_008983 [Quaeritorhiza haematococci]|nr:hypothetical protein HK102_008983 [Quaeritorhiza haematococci]